MNFNNSLTIDIGNTNTTCSFNNKEKTKYLTLRELPSLIEEFKLTSNNTKTIISSVNKEIPEGLSSLEPIFLKDHFKDDLFFTMPVNYNETVGLDRLTCAFYAFHNKMSATIIDTGSFTTIDFIDSKGFNGGYILPGFKLLKEAFKTGSLLREFKPNLSKQTTVPQKSKDAIDLGLTESFIAPIKSIISKNMNAQILLTGGNSDLLINQLNCKLEKRLIHKSMQLILKEYL